MRERFIEIGRNRLSVTCRVRRRNVMYEDTENEKEKVSRYFIYLFFAQIWNIFFS